MLKLRSRSVPKALLVMVGVFWVLMVAAILVRHYAMYPSFSTHDQGIFNQVFWNSAQGQWFESTLSSGESSAVEAQDQLSKVTYRRLGQHFTPIHLLWLPIYKLFPFSATLLVLQVTLVTAGGMALYYLARTRLSQQLAIWITLGYFCAQAVIGPNLANFHDFSQIPLLVFLMLLAVEHERWAWAALAAVLVFLCREDTGIILFGIGLYFVLSRRHPRFGAVLCVAGVAQVVLVTTVIMPMFSEEIGERFLTDVYDRYVESDNPSTIALLLGFLRHPHWVLQDLLLPFSSTVRFLAGHWLPLVFVPAVSPAAWICIAPPAAVLLLRSDTHIALSMQLRYTLMLVPGVFYGAIVWWANRPQRPLSMRTKRLWTACLCLSLLFAFTLNPSRSWSYIIPDSIQPWVYVSLPQQWSHAQDVRSLISQMPPDASLSSTDNLLPHVSGRRAVLRFPRLEYRNDAGAAVFVDYLLIDLWQLRQYAPAFSGSTRRLEEWTPLIQSLIEEGRYGVVGAEQGVFLLRLGQPSDPAALDAWQAFRQAGLSHMRTFS